MKGRADERPVALGEFRGAVDAGLYGSDFLAVLADPGKLMSRGREIHAGRNTLTALTLDLPGLGLREVVLKRFRPRGVDRLKTLILPSKPLRAWRGAGALVERGIPTPRPLAWFERRKGGMMAEGFFLAERTENAREVRDLFRQFDGERLEGLLRSLAGFLKMCHERGILHRDLSDGNVLAAEDGRGGFVFHLLDTNRVRVLKRVTSPRAAANMVRLGVPRGKRMAFLAHYSGGRPPKAFVLWYVLRKSWYASWVLLKKNLRLRKLSRKLGVQ